MNDTISPLSRFTFSKEERLSRKKLIDELFKSGSSFYLHPFKIIFLQKKIETRFPLQILISVSKKNYKRAVDRNRIKRLIREAYRLNKHLLYASLQERNKQLIIAVLFTSKTIESFSVIQQKLVAVLKRLAEEKLFDEKFPA